MPYPASKPLLVDVLRDANTLILELRNGVLTLARLSAIGNIERSKVLTLLADLAKAVRQLQGYAAVDGIGPYAQQQFADPTLDVRAEFLAVRTELVALRDWIAANFPKDAEGNFIWRDGDGQPLHFTTEQTAQFRTRAAAFMATIS